MLATEVQQGSLEGSLPSLLKLAMCATLQATSHTWFHACNVAEPKSSIHPGSWSTSGTQRLPWQSWVPGLPWVGEELSILHTGKDKPPGKGEE